MSVIDFRFRGIDIQLAGPDSLRVNCSRPVANEEKLLIAKHKTSLLAELRPPSKEVVAELVARGFPHYVAEGMRLLEAREWLARDGGSRWR